MASSSRATHPIAAYATSTFDGQVGAQFVFSSHDLHPIVDGLPQLAHRCDADLWLLWMQNSSLGPDAEMQSESRTGP